MVLILPVGLLRQKVNITRRDLNTGKSPTETILYTNLPARFENDTKFVPGPSGIIIQEITTIYLQGTVNITEGDIFTLLPSSDTAEVRGIKKEIGPDGSISFLEVTAW